MRSSRDMAGVSISADRSAPDEIVLSTARPYFGVRRALFVAGGLLILGALYLIAVRGSAILADISAMGARVWCF